MPWILILSCRCKSKRCMRSSLIKIKDQGDQHKIIKRKTGEEEFINKIFVC